MAVEAFIESSIEKKPISSRAFVHIILGQGIESRCMSDQRHVPRATAFSSGMSQQYIWNKL